MTAKPKDRRIFERLRDVVNIRYSVQGRDKTKNECLPRDISGGGLGMCVPETIKAGTLLDLEITVPDNPKKTIKGSGEVLWSKPFGHFQTNENVTLHDIGVRFLNIEPLAIGRVYSYSRENSHN